MNKHKKTVGSLARDLLLKPDIKQGVVDTQREADKKYFSEVEKCVKSKPHSEWKNPWYLVVIHKKERLLENVVRRYFLGRKSLPTPEYDQTVWRYYPNTGSLEFIWCVPDKNTTLWISENPELIHPEQEHLKNFSLAFLTGSLYSSILKKYPE